MMYLLLSLSQLISTPSFANSFSCAEIQPLVSPEVSKSGNRSGSLYAISSSLCQSFRCATKPSASLGQPGSSCSDGLCVTGLLLLEAVSLAGVSALHPDNKHAKTISNLIVIFISLSRITATFTGPRQKSLFPKAARPAAPCATYCYHASGGHSGNTISGSSPT